MKFKPSKYQEEIYNFVESGEGNGVINAVAGSGKTTTIIESTKRIPSGRKSLFIAFNKQIQLELREKLPSSVKAQTLHGYGYGLFFNTRNTLRPPTVDSKGEKLYGITKSVLHKKKQLYKHKISGYMKVVKCLKNELLEPDEKNIKLVCFRYNIDLDYDIIPEKVKLILDMCLENDQIIDFEDMIWIPIKKDFQTRKYDYVFIDELQDLNRSQFELVKRMCNGNTRIIGVGDPRQSIYGFRGADKNTIETFKKHFKAKELPLSICYRCPKSVVFIAQTIVPQIEPFEENEEGTVEAIDNNQLIDNLKENDVVLCRVNAPLFQLAFSLIRQDIKVTIRGKEIGKGLIKYIERTKSTTLDSLREQLEENLKNQYNALKLIKDGYLERSELGPTISTIDKIKTIKIITYNVDSIEGLKSKIKELFSEKKDGIILSTIHRYKGLENERIFLLDYDKMPHPLAQTPDEIDEEYNIKYVGITRAKKELYLVDSN